MEEISSNEAANVDSFDQFIWPLCGTFTMVDGCWLAPRIPEAMLAAALATYLDLAADELLLVLVDLGSPQAPAPVCALTTKRVYWPGVVRDGSEPVDVGRPALPPGAPLPSRCEYLGYNALPESIAVAGVTAKAVDLGDGREIALGTKTRPLRALVAFLAEARARVRGEAMLPEIPWAARDMAGRAWPDVARFNVAARLLQSQIRSGQAVFQAFRARTFAATRVVMTPVFAAACVLVFVAMVLEGVSPSHPANEAMLAWGANFGPLVVEKGQVWRLFTCQFLHFGAMHLAMNVISLLAVGPLVERFFGHLGFAALYLLSGFGGALASLYFHSTSLCAGASGAIFGVIGGLLGFLLVRGHDIPLAILKPMRSRTLACVVINLASGTMIPSIDIAGHIGGLVTGCVVGLCLGGGAITRPDPVGLVRRVVTIAALALALAALSRWTIRTAGSHIATARAADPVHVSAQASADAFNDFQHAGRPVFEQLDRTAQGLDSLVKDVEAAETPSVRLLSRIESTIAGTEHNIASVGALPQRNDEIRALAAKLISGQQHLRRALELLKGTLQTGDRSVLQGPDGLDAQLNAYLADVNAFRTARERYIKTHGLVPHEAAKTR